MFLLRPPFAHCRKIHNEPKLLITKCEIRTVSCSNAVELHLSALIRTASHPDKQKIRIIGFFFFLKISCIGSLQFSCYCAQNVPASKPLEHAYTVFDMITGNFKAS